MKKKFDVLVLEDEHLSRKHIIHELQQIEEFEFNIYESSDILTARQLLIKHRPQLLLLDIQIKSQLSFELLENLPFSDFQIIFITAYDHYAVKAIKLSAVDYILKPIQTEEFQQAIQNAVEEIERNNFYNKLKMEHFKHTFNEPEESIIVHSGREAFKVYYREILYLQADSNYTRIYFINRNPVMVAKTLKYYAELLKEHFIRTHQSYLVNKSHIDKVISTKQKSVVRMVNGVEIPISTRMRHIIDWEEI
ncbi:MAG: LytTR family DNA-binding domain-containing protein [Bacteroidia bacterium]|nr:LytTR family DNA-binding domain-containing protein [Bacteroidia bacterium]MDW8301548.1 LytTR family DNA-binding domain-containing protein [Bacteroidia bacterium]